MVTVMAVSDGRLAPGGRDLRHKSTKPVACQASGFVHFQALTFQSTGQAHKKFAAPGDGVGSREGNGDDGQVRKVFRSCASFYAPERSIARRFAAGWVSGDPGMW
jgi:hypothetical protein